MSTTTTNAKSNSSVTTSALWSSWLPRVSLWQMFLLIGLVAVGFGLLRFPAYLVSQSVETVVLAMFVLAMLLTIYGKRTRRAFWIGYLICGLSYFALAHDCVPLVNYRTTLITDPLNELLFQTMHADLANLGPYGPPMPSYYQPSTVYSPPVSSSTLIPAPASSYPSTYLPPPNAVIGLPATIRYFDEVCFLRIAECLWTLLCAIAGGYIAWMLQRRNAQTTTSSQ